MEMIGLDSTVLGAGLLATALVVYHTYTSLTGPLADLPGPTWSKFTALPVVYHIYGGTRMYLLHGLHKKYGPVVRVTPNEVSIASPSAAKDIHKFRSEYLKTQFYEDWSFDKAQNIFTTADPAYHAEWRRLYSRAVSQGNLITFLPLFRKYVTLLIRQIERERQEQGWVDLVKWFKWFTSDVTGELSIGSTLGMLETGKESQYVEDIKRVMPTNIFRLALWQSDFAKTRHLPFFPFSTLRGIGERLSSLAKAYIDDYRVRISSGSGEGNIKQSILLDKALETQASDGRASISDDEVTSNAVLLMLAGTDTTANSLAYMLWLLFTYPDVKERLVKEIEDARLPGQAGIEDLARLKYLECFMLESMRLYGAAPGPLPRKVPPGGRTLCGHFIPAAATVSPLAYSISRDPVVYAPEPDRFDPDRWATAAPDKLAAMRDADFTFGGGSRICLGMHIAQLQMKLVIVAFLQSPGLRGAELAYGVNGFTREGMKQLEAISARPWGDQVLIH